LAVVMAGLYHGYISGQASVHRTQIARSQSF
jgi:hypothetical protein